MFPVELLSRVADSVLEVLAGKAVDRLLSRYRDSPKKFARDLFAFYEDLKTYIDTCNDLIRVMESPSLQPQATAGYNFDHANRLAERLAEITGNLMDRFFPVFEIEHFEYPGRREPNKKAVRRGAVMNIYDEQLVDLTRMSYRGDVAVIAWVRHISMIYFDKERNELWTYMPVDGDIRPLLQYGIFYGLPYFTGGGQTDPPEDITRLSFSDDRQDIQQVVELIRHNVEVVQDLRQQVRESIRTHFSISDLL